MHQTPLKQLYKECCLFNIQDIDDLVVDQNITDDYLAVKKALKFIIMLENIGHSSR